MNLKAWFDLMALDPELLKHLPNLLAGEYVRASDKSDEYNCIAWAIGETARPWWPWERYYWPPEVPYEETLDAFVAVFKLQGYEPCDDAGLEDQYEKVAIFANQDRTPTHAAIQRPNGMWSSKLGIEEDIEHRLNGVEGPMYGTVAVILRRPRGG